MKIVIIILAATLILPQVAIEQKASKKSKQATVQKEDQPNARQLDLVQRMQYDMTNPTENSEPLMMIAYGGGRNYQSDLERISDGLLDNYNLPAIIHYVKKFKHDIATEVTMSYIFPSLTQEEREHFLWLSDEELTAVSHKYAKWIKDALSQWQSQPKY